MIYLINLFIFYLAKMKTLLTNYTFVPWLAWAWYITFNDYSISNPLKIENLASITNKNNGMYLFVSWNSNNLLDDWVNYYAQNSWVITSWNTLTFTIDTTMHSWSDKLQIIIEESDLINPWSWAFAITPNDSTNLASVPREIYVGVGGNIALTFVNGGTVTLVNVADGTRLPYRASRVFATGTTATNLIAIL